MLNNIKMTSLELVFFILVNFINYKNVFTLTNVSLRVHVTVYTCEDFF